MRQQRDDGQRKDPSFLIGLINLLRIGFKICETGDTILAGAGCLVKYHQIEGRRQRIASAVMHARCNLHRST
jgi:hypothetical protein